METRCDVWTDRSFTSEETGPRPTEYSGRTPDTETSGPVSFQNAATPSRPAWKPQAERLDQPEGDSLVIATVSPAHSRDLAPRTSNARTPKTESSLAGGGIQTALLGVLLATSLVLYGDRNRSEICEFSAPACDNLADVIQEARFQSEELLHRLLAEL